MKSMLDLTQNRYSSQWRADNAQMTLSEAKKLIHQKAPVTSPNMTVKDLKNKWQQIIGDNWSSQELQEIWDYSAQFIKTKK